MKCEIAMVTGKTIAKVRLEYSDKPLLEKTLRRDPLDQFEIWLKEAFLGQLYEPNAMVLSTATTAGRPSSRAVLLKGFDRRGLVFFTNYESRKGCEVAQNPQVSLLFYWAELHRQIRIEGSIKKVSRAESIAYFKERPTGAKFGAWASEQSRVLASREILERKVALLEVDAEKEDLLCPPHWGGYRINPKYFEFWQGRRNRLHDRIVYSKSKSSSAKGGWLMKRLYP